MLISHSERDVYPSMMSVENNESNYVTAYARPLPMMQLHWRRPTGNIFTMAAMLVIQKYSYMYIEKLIYEL